MNFSAVSKITDFLARHRKKIETAGLIGAEVAIGVILHNKYDMPLTVGNDIFSVSTRRPEPDLDFSNLDLMFRPKNAKCQAIYSTTKAAMDYWSDIKKKDAASDIFKLVYKNDTDEETREYAILCMGKIRETMSMDYYKSDIQKMIMKLF